MKGLSPKQQGILKFMREFIDEHDYPPSIRDIQVGCDVSSTSRSPSRLPLGVTQVSELYSGI